MSGPYFLLGDPGFDLDYRRIDAAASRNPTGPEAWLRRQILRQLLDLSKGKTDGHHALGYEAGKGDLRDCVVGYVQSDPERKADYRLVFREIGPSTAGELPRRELLAIKTRHGSNNIYAHVCARLNRHPADRQPGLDRFGDRPADSGGSQATRQAELDTKRAIAHAWAGQQPLASSRPLALPDGPPHSNAAAPSLQPQRPTIHTPPGPGPRHARPSPTGWPTRTPA
ncbi:hypothetical protein AB0F43_04130 [Kribbella sp. NPDC023972]|uniref:hypothetical protein n=1 Tax=Kribbella sp. NPDC023972 TaxID=3154795 RepID=UPI0033DC2053